MGVLGVGDEITVQKGPDTTLSSLEAKWIPDISGEFRGRAWINFCDEDEAYLVVSRA